MKYKYTHWLKMNIDTIEKVWIRLKEFKEKYNCNMEVFYKETNLVIKYIKLECNQSYQDLDLDVNSITDEGLWHLSRKPNDIYKYKYPIEYFFKEYINGECIIENIINEENIDEYRENINSSYQDSIKLTLLNILEVAHPTLLQSNQITESMLDEISNKIAEDEEFNDYVDSLIHNEIEQYKETNNIEEEEDEETI
ncbi:MAG: hypothetical protein HFJ53_03065 [Clostridia bacterium]|jgi:hypothetical protein|nr:hypothetical protein [Clostridia bacterium]